MTTQAIQKLPYGVGQWSQGAKAAIAIALAIVGVGLFAYSRQLIEGEIVTGMRDIGTMGGATWGLYVAFVVYFVGVSFAGITVAALIRLLNLERLRPVARMAEGLTIVSLVLAALMVIIDLGQPERGIVNLLLYARPQSPFFGTFTLVISAYLFASLVYLYLDGRRDAALCAQRPSRLQRFFRLWAAGYTDTTEERERHHRTAWWLALFILPLLVTAHSTLGMVFGIQPGRPGWYSALQAPSFVVLAGVSGVGLLIVIVAVLRKTLRLEQQLDIRVFRWLGNFLWVLTAAYLYFIVIDFLTVNYSGGSREAAVFKALISGSYAWLFWLTLSSFILCFIIMFGQFAARRYSISLIVIAGVLANIAAMGKRDVIVVPSQTHGTLLPYPPGVYTPTWVELAIILGLFGLGTFLYIVFTKMFPIMEVDAGGHEATPHGEDTERRWRDGIMRKRMFILTLMVGISLAAVGFLLTAPLGPTTDPMYSEPRVQFAPLMFVAGIIITLLSPVVYELFPDRREGN
jgi:Ni/Fe-hydrogenase subunit HybB-like protein